MVETVYRLRKQGHRVIIVSSGAVGIGLQRMQKSAPSKVSEKQALAAIGQGRLIGIWDNLFGQMGIPVAQILLTVSDVVQVCISLLFNPASHFGFDFLATSICQRRQYLREFALLRRSTHRQ